MKGIFSSLLLLIIHCANAQTVYVPRDIMDAYQKDTRSISGSPGKNYWQNSASYIINIESTPPSRIINGEEEIVYTNNSPDTLRNIFFRLIQNQHLIEAEKNGDIDTNAFTGGIIVKKFSINGEEKSWINPNRNFTVNTIKLDKPLLPHSSTKINCTWSYEICAVGDREGVIDSTTFYMAYFYPRVAVYDDYTGWDRIPFTGRQEFYNDFNDYVLNVSVPANYLVWSTGILQNAEQVLQTKYFDRLIKSIATDSVIPIVTKEDLLSGNITKKNIRNTWTWNAENVMDVAFGISDHYVWDATSILVDPKRARVSVQAAYNDSAWDFHYVAKEARNALEYFSHQLPGVPYPYPKMTVVQGYADEEYPMMVNDNTYDTYREMQWTANHEIAHTYFPFYMGINENRFAFMDEGWATFLELQMELAQMPRDSAIDLFTGYRLKRYTNNKTPEVAMPISTASYAVSGQSYGVNSYGKPALAYQALKDLLGEKLFKKCLQYYMKEWNGKHPVPYDFYYCFNTCSGQDLNWFWNNWFFSDNYIDVGISDVKIVQEKYTVSLSNVGGFAIPIDIKIIFKDATSEVIHKSPDLWKANLKSADIQFTSKKEIVSINLVEEVFLDADKSNNVWKSLK